MRKVGVFIGRFQPFHVGHYEIVKSALSQVDYLIMVLGSHLKSLNTRDPLTTDQRIKLIQASLTPDELERVRFVKVEDHDYNLDKWIAGVNSAGYNASLPWHSGPTSYYLVGMMKDHTSFYLNLFPNWKSFVCGVNEAITELSSTDIRRDWYLGNTDNISEMFTTHEAYEIFNDYISENDKRSNLRYEFDYEVKYPTIWGDGPHLTVDSCVVQAGHILLIQRGKEYGHGKWALPGGFVNKNETTADASLRELREETKIKLPTKILMGSLVNSHLYDAPHRSNRGRVVTNTFYYRLSDVGELPRVVGADDAMDAKWVPISKFQTMQSVMFEDHYSMISDVLKI